MRVFLSSLLCALLFSNILVAQTDQPDETPTWNPPDELRSGLKIVKDFDLPESYKMKEFKAGMGTYRFSPKVSGNNVIVLEIRTKKLFQFSMDGEFKEELLDTSEVNDGFPEFLNDNMIMFRDRAETAVYNLDGKHIFTFKLGQNSLIDAEGTSGYIIDYALIKNREGTIREIYPEGETISTWGFPPEMAVSNREWRLWIRYPMKDRILLVDRSYPGFFIADKSAEDLVHVKLRDDELAELFGGSQSRTSISNICGDKKNIFLCIADRQLTRIVHTSIDGEIENVYEIPRFHFQINAFDVALDGSTPRIFASGYKVDPKTFESSQALVILEPGGKVFARDEIEKIEKKARAALVRQRERKAAKSGGKDIETLAHKLYKSKSVDEKITIYKEMLKLHPNELRTTQMLDSFSYFRPGEEPEKGKLNEIYALVKKQMNSGNESWNNSYKRDHFFSLAGNTKDNELIVDAAHFMLKQEPSYRSMRDVQVKAMEIGEWDIASVAAGKLIELPEDEKYAGNYYSDNMGSLFKSFKLESRAIKALALANKGNPEEAIPILENCLKESAKNLVGIEAGKYDLYLADAYILAGKKENALKVLLPGMLYGDKTSRLSKFSNLFEGLFPGKNLEEYLEEQRFKNPPKMVYTPLLCDLDKNIVELKEHFGKKLTVLTVWWTATMNQDTYNKPVVEVLTEFKKKFAPKGCRIIAIDTRSNTAEVKDMIEKGQINFKCFEVTSEDQNTDWRTSGTYIFDSKGRALYFFNIEEVKTQPEVIEGIIAKLLGV